jgi:hypothetical protein
LPKELLPISTPRPASCRAAATISEAEAELPLIRIASGRPAARSSFRASKN